MTPYFETPQVKLFQGDCLEVLPTLPDKSVDLILTDLPYGTTQNAWDAVIPFEPLWAQFKRLIRPNRAVALFASQPFTSEVVLSNRKWFKYEWIWEKTQVSNFLNADKQPLKNHESVLLFYERQCLYNPQKTSGQPYSISRTHGSSNYGKQSANKTVNLGERFPKSVLKIASGRDTEHPTAKPVSLLSYLIRTYTNEGDTVLDCTMGSGSTIVAAKDTGRKGIGIELDPTYCEIAARRCSQLTIFQEVTA